MWAVSQLVKSSPDYFLFAQNIFNYLINFGRAQTLQSIPKSHRVLQPHIFYPRTPLLPAQRLCTMKLTAPLSHVGLPFQKVSSEIGRSSAIFMISALSNKHSMGLSRYSIIFFLIWIFSHLSVAIIVFIISIITFNDNRCSNFWPWALKSTLSWVLTMLKAFQSLLTVWIQNI